MIIYALLAVLLWPADRAVCRGAVRRGAGGRAAHGAGAVGSSFWLSQAYFVLTPENRAPQAASALIAGMESGEPGWLAGLMRGAASLVAGQGLAVSVALAAAFVLIAAGVYLPVRAARATLVLAIVLAAVFWLFVQALGGLLASGATDPESGPLLALLALAYWRRLVPSARIRLPSVPPSRPMPCRRRSAEIAIACRWRSGEPGPMTPAWILDVLAALMLVVAAVSAARIASARPWRRGAFVADTDVAHLLMAIAMAGMLAPGLGTLPDTAWEVVFGLLAAWFAGRVARDARASGVRALAGGHCAPHLVHSASMLYMFLAASVPAAGRGRGGMGGMPGGAGHGAMTLQPPRSPSSSRSSWSATASGTWTSSPAAVTPRGRACRLPARARRQCPPACTVARPVPGPRRCRRRAPAVRRATAAGSWRRASPPTRCPPRGGHDAGGGRHGKRRARVPAVARGNGRLPDHDVHRDGRHAAHRALRAPA